MSHEGEPHNKEPVEPQAGTESESSPEEKIPLPDHVVEFLKTPVSEDVLEDARKSVRQQTLGFIPPSQQESSEFYQLATEEHAQTIIKALRGELGKGVTLQQFIQKAYQLPVDSKFRESRIRAIELFGAALRHTYMPDESSTSEEHLNEEERRMVDSAEHLVRIADFLKGEGDEQFDIEGSLGLKQAAEKEAVSREKPRTVNPEQKPAQRWKLGVEHARTSEQKEALDQRRQWLEQVMDAADINQAGLDAPASEVHLTIIKHLGKPGGFVRGKSETVFSRKSAEPGVSEHARNAWWSDLRKGKKSLNEALTQASTIEDLKAFRLIGLSLLQEGYENNNQVVFQELSEEKKRLVRLGEMIGLEAERKMLEQQMAAGRVSQEKAQLAYNRYEQYGRNGDIPEAFAQRCTRTAALLERVFPTLETRERKVRIEKPLRTEARAPQPAQQEQLMPQEPPEPGAEQFDTLVEAQFAFIPDIPKSHLEHFLEYLPEQTGYANAVAKDASRSFVGRWSARIMRVVTLYRPDAHWQVFGVKGAFRSIFQPRKADQEMMKVRAGMIEALHRAGEQYAKRNIGMAVSGQDIGGSFGEYEAALAGANLTERMRQDEKALAKNIIDISKQEEQKPAEPEQQASESGPKDVISGIRNWVEQNPGGKFKDWETDADDEVYATFVKLIQDRGLKPKKAWKRIRDREIERLAGRRKAA